MSQRKGLVSIVNERLKAARRKLPVSTGLLVVSSAALGGIAVALWNRKALANFRELALEEQSRGATANAQADEAENNFY
jgi:hypothetical protein